MANKKKIRLGIDVGSSFTKVAAVALLGDSWEVIARQKAPTTHQSPRSLAEGISQTIGSAAEQGAFTPADVSFVCLGTTEPANDLLRGDVAPVGVLTLGPTQEQMRKRAQTSLRNLGDSESKPRIPNPEPRLSNAGASLPSGQPAMRLQAQVDLSRGYRHDEITSALYQLRSQGAEAIVAVASPIDEQSVAAAAEAIGLPACGTHKFSTGCGDEEAVRTALVNAGVLPRVTKVIELTELALREKRIQTPLVIMRNDGGGDLRDTVKAKPLAALLSGAAAALAGAIGWGKVRHGVFLDIGATSTSISIVRDGTGVLGESEVGSFNTHLLSSALGIVGVGSGSIIRLRRGAIAQVGPRSTATSGLADALEADPRELRDLRLVLLRPTSGDPEEYAAVESASGNRFALTVAGAALLLGGGHSEVEAQEHIHPQPPNPESRTLNPESARLAFEPLAARLALGLQDTAELVVESATEELARQVRAVIRKHYSAMTGTPTLYGGGGAAAVCLPLLARKLGLDYKIIADAEFVSAIGLAIGRFQETVEFVRQNGREPSEADIAQWRQQAEARLLSLGVERDTMETQVEIERIPGLARVGLGAPGSALESGTSVSPVVPSTKAGVSPAPHSSVARASASASRTVVRVITSGMILTPPGDRITPSTKPLVAPDQRFRLAADTMKIAESRVTLLAETNSLEVYTAPARPSNFWSLVRRQWAKLLGKGPPTTNDTEPTMEKQRVCVCDKEGVVRLTLSDACVVLTKAAAVGATLRLLLEGRRGGSRARGPRRESTPRGSSLKSRGWGAAFSSPCGPNPELRIPTAGAIRFPRLFLVHGARVSDLCELQRVEQVMALAAAELAGLEENSPVVVLAEF